MSVVAGAITKYGTLAMSVTRPPIYFSSIPQTNASGTPISTADGYVNLVDEGTAVQQSTEEGFDLEYNPIEVTTLRFEVYGPTLVFVDAVMAGIKYGTGTPSQRQGFDFGTLTVGGQTEMECRRTHEQRSRAPQMSETAEYVWQGSIWYTVQMNVAG